MTGSTQSMYAYIIDNRPPLNKALDEMHYKQTLVLNYYYGGCREATASHSPACLTESKVVSIRNRIIRVDFPWMQRVMLSSGKEGCKEVIPTSASAKGTAWSIAEWISGTEDEYLDTG
uniref:Uncharacterized protein n=1 Tax=Glossina pallidipes TaxID=7398 RepID=A0A1A9ZRH2_GLOPL